MSNNLVSPVSKNRLIDISTQHFMDMGYRASALSKIAFEADLDKSTLYHYFSSKTDIAIQVIRKISDFYEKNLFPIVDKRSLGAEEKILEFIKTLKMLMMDGGVHLMIIPTFIFEGIPELIEPINYQRERWIKVMSTLLAPLYSPYLSEKFSRNAWRLIVGTFVDIKTELSPDRRVAIATELEFSLKRLWLKETF